MNNPTPILLDPVLNTYFAIQLQPRENPIVAVEAFCVTAQMMKTLFRRIETLDVIQVGMRPFVRLRSDIGDAGPVLRQLLAATNRGYIVSNGGRFEAQFSAKDFGGRKADVSGVVMNTVPRGPQVMYRGPKIKNWERQFLKG